MLCRGYGRETALYRKKVPLARRDWVFLVFSLSFIIVVPLMVYTRPTVIFF
jgi:energy-coupling factor transporter transmembrane protein EcfT